MSIISRIKRDTSFWGRATYGGGKGSTVETIAATPTAAPASEEATLEEFSDANIDEAKVKSKTQGAKSLQIPLVGSTTADGSTVGTV